MNITSPHSASLSLSPFLDFQVPFWCALRVTQKHPAPATPGTQIFFLQSCKQALFIPFYWQPGLQNTLVLTCGLSKCHQLCKTWGFYLWYSQDMWQAHGTGKTRDQNEGKRGTGRWHLVRVCLCNVPYVIFIHIKHHSWSNQNQLSCC